MTTDASAHVVIVGGGQAAITIAQTLRQKKFAGPITIVCGEDQPPYERPPLSKAFLKGDLDADRLPFKKMVWYRDRDVSLLLKTRATAIDRASMTVSLSDGTELSYDYLVLATGGDARLPDLAGCDLPGVFTLRTLDDSARIREHLLGSTGGQHRLVIVGGGYIGLEVAAAARGLADQADIKVTLVEQAPRLLARSASPALASLVEERHREAGVEFRFETTAGGLVGDDRLIGLTIGRAEMVAADSLLIGIGIIPSVDLAVDAGLECENGIIIDDHSRTSDSHIFAAGDCARGPVFGSDEPLRLESVPQAIEQARRVALTILGESVPDIMPVPWFWSDQYELSIQIAGISHAEDDVIERRSEDGLSLCHVRDDRLTAIETVNASRDFAQARKLIAEDHVIDHERLADASQPLKSCIRDQAAAAQ